MLPNTLFQSSGLTETEKNADLVLYLLTYLDQLREPHEGIWQGDRQIRTLQYTSHVVEALHFLNLGGVTSGLMEPAANWLLNLPFGNEPEHLPLRIYPSRLKTMAL